ncbi:MAG TPA: tripartite tricarboxylate transporter substrate binding protein [Burkholderiales bacterium]|nr:tripartite tricarboxylate transporter substrate binding protein [Burkholderiales bacterium]
MLISTPIFAQHWPVRPVRYIVPFPPGGGSDVAARAIAVKLSEAWGQQVVVDNRPGAATLLGTDLAAKAPPDGYTLLHASASYAINPHLQKKMPYETLKDHTPVTQAAYQPYVLVTHPSVAARNVKEFIALARAKPGALNFGSPGAGSGGHLAVEHFRLASNTVMVHVPYRGGAPALTDLIAGQIQFMFPTMLAVAPHVKTGRLRSLAVTSAKRAAVLPDLPTISESGLPGFEATSWNGVMTPAGVAPAIIAKIHKDVVHALRAADVRDKLAADGAEAVGNTPQEFAQIIRNDLAKWGKVIAATGLKLE